MSISNWEEAKKRSNYHFDTSIIDTTNIESLGRFHGDWKEDLEFAIDCAEKINWANRRAAANKTKR